MNGAFEGHNPPTEALDFLLSCYPHKYPIWLRVCQKIGYTFKDRTLLAEAFTHRSALSELSQKLSCETKKSWIAWLPWNERMEFLGDSVLSLVISSWLWHHKRSFSEGEFSKKRSLLVQEKTLVQVAHIYDIGQCVLLGSAAEKSGAGNNDGLLGDTLEAFVGAVYLDSDFARVCHIVEHMFAPFLEDISDKEACLLEDVEDHKSRLQELSQMHYGSLPEYILVSEEGLAHAKEFVMECHLQGKCLATGKGSSKKRASQHAAAQALQGKIFSKHAGIHTKTSATTK